MVYEEKFELNIEKLKPRDRLALLSHYETGAIFHNSLGISAETNYMTFAALLVSAFALIVSITRCLFIIVPVFIIFILLCLILIKNLRKIRSNLKNRTSIITVRYNELFIYHFKYAKKNK